MDPSLLSRKELQKLAKENGVRANGKTVFIISQLQIKGVLSSVESSAQKVIV